MRPSTPGRSKTAGLALQGAPTATASVAAITRWAKEFWRSCAKDPRAVTLSQLQAWWEAALGTGRPRPKLLCTVAVAAGVLLTRGKMRSLVAARAGGAA